MLRFGLIALFAAVVSVLPVSSAKAGAADLAALVPDASEQVHKLLHEVEAAYANRPASATYELKGEVLSVPAKITVWRKANQAAEVFRMGSEGGTAMKIVMLMDDEKMTILKNGVVAPAQGRFAQVAAMGKGNPLGTIKAMLKSAKRVGVGHGHVDHEPVTWLVLHQEHGLPWQVGFYETGTIAGIVHPMPSGHGLAEFVGFGKPKAGAKYPTPTSMNIYIIHENAHGGFGVKPGDGAAKIGELKVVSEQFDVDVNPDLFKLSTWQKPGKGE
ncbi:MAG: hypothetical protein MK101_05035 [Phycisphaerales bacterium]|nr:hypothetical protein [Phycisphaerales bacterium]